MWKASEGDSFVGRVRGGAVAGARGALALIGGMQAILLTSLVILYLVPSELRRPVAVAWVALNWLLFVWAMPTAKTRLQKTGKPFQTTWDRSQKDMECLNQLA